MFVGVYSACVRERSIVIDDRGGVGPLGGLPDDLRKIARLHMVRVRHLQSQGNEVEPQLIEAVRIRLRMHAIEPWDPVTFEELRGLHVGGNHALLDQSMRIVAWHDFDAIDLAIPVELELGLREIDFDSAATPRAFANAL